MNNLTYFLTVLIFFSLGELVWFIFPRDYDALHGLQPVNDEAIKSTFMGMGYFCITDDKFIPQYDGYSVNEKTYCSKQ